MSRTNIDIDDELVAWVMGRYGLQTKREAVDYALRRLRRTPMTREQALAMEGTGWDGDLDAMRSGRPAPDLTDADLDAIDAGAPPGRDGST